MTKLNNKGQSLVMFILIIPILLLMFVIVFDIGNAFVSKQELDNINNLAIDYGLEHITEDNLETKLIEMINTNNDTLKEISVLVEDNKIKVTIKKNINGILAKGFKILEIESKYEALLESDFLDGLHLNIMYKRDYDKNTDYLCTKIAAMYKGTVPGQLNKKRFPVKEQLYLVEDVTKELLARAATFKTELEMKINDK